MTLPGYFHVGPIARDILDIMWTRYAKAVRQADKREQEKWKLAVEQFMANHVRQMLERGCPDGNKPLPSWPKAPRPALEL